VARGLHLLSGQPGRNPLRPRSGAGADHLSQPGALDRRVPRLGQAGHEARRRAGPPQLPSYGRGRLLGGRMTKPQVVNAFTAALESDADDPPGYRPHEARIGPLLGATMLGATIYELEPGNSNCPYHYEYGN